MGKLTKITSKNYPFAYLFNSMPLEKLLDEKLKAESDINRLKDCKYLSFNLEFRRIELRVINKAIRALEQIAK